MGRRRRRAGVGRAVGLGVAAGAALGLGLALAAWGWARSPPREPPEELPGALELLGPPVGRSARGWFLNHLDRGAAPRERRSVAKGKNRNRNRRPTATPAAAAHYRVKFPGNSAGISSGHDGTIRDWEETPLNATGPLRYNPATGEFTIVRRGLYYLYCQVHFNEGGTVYMKLDVVVDGALALRCLEQFPPTSAGPPHPDLRVCQVAGLLPLQPPGTLRLKTIPRVRLKAEPYLTFFGLFQVH